MKFTFRTSPNYRNELSTKRIMAELTLGLLVLSLFSVFYNFTYHGAAYGTQAVMMLLTAVLVSVVVEVLWAVGLKKDIVKHLMGSFPVVTALIFVLMCPIGTPLYVVGVGTFFAIFFGKLMFGGFGHNIFNPAGVGRAVLFASFTSVTVPYLTKFSEGQYIMDKGAGVIVDAITSVTPTSYIAQKLNWVVNNQLLADRLIEKFGGWGNLFVGFYQGALGETFSALIIVIGIILAIRKVIDWRVPVFYVGTVAVLATMIGLMNGSGLWYPAFHILSGGLLFGAVFMATDPVTNPTHPLGRIIFAIGCGILTVLIRIKANLPEGVLYSILLMNMMSPLIDNVLNGESIVHMKKNVMKVIGVFVAGTAVVALAGSVVKPKDPRVLIDVSANDLLQVRANLIARETAGSDVAYTVWSDGYWSSANPKEKQPNIFKVFVNEATKTISKVEVVALNDSKGIAEKVKAEEFLAQFANLKMAEPGSIEILDDVVTGATVTSKSVIRAAREVINLYEGNQVSVVSDGADEMKVRVTYDSYYIAFNQTHKGETESHPNTAVFTIDKLTGALKAWEVESWGDSSGMDKRANNVLLPYIERGDTLDTFFTDDALATATYSQTSSLTAAKSALLEFAGKR